MTTTDKVKWVAYSFMLAGVFAVGVGVGGGATATFKPDLIVQTEESESRAPEPPAIPTKIDGLLPQFRVQSNSPTDYRVAFKAWNATEWAVSEPPFRTHAEAEAVMARSQDRLKERMEIWRPLYEK